MTTETNTTTHAAPPTPEQISAIENAPRILPDARFRRVWCNYILETVLAFGSAARNNRARYTGTKVHRLSCEYIVGLVDESLAENPRTMGATWVRTRQPVLFSCRPCCGTTGGQHAGAPDARRTASDVTCSKCA